MGGQEEAGSWHDHLNCQVPITVSFGVLVKEFAKPLPNSFNLDQFRQKIFDVVGSVTSARLHDGFVVNFNKFTDFTAGHCLVETDFPLEAIPYCMPVILIEGAEMSTKPILNVLRIMGNETVNGVAFGAGVPGVEDMAILQLDNMTGLNVAATLENHEVGCRTVEVQQFALPYLSLAGKQNTLCHRLGFKEFVQVMDVGHQACDHCFKFRT